MLFHVTPKKACITEKLKISGRGFEPSSALTIYATVCYPSEGINMHSYAQISTASDGSFDLQNTESVGGSYTGIDGMGLFWSMKHKQKSIYDSIVITNGFCELEYKFDVYNGHIGQFKDQKTSNILCSSTCVRCFGDSTKIRRKEVKDGAIRGTLFTPIGASGEEGPFPAVIAICSVVKRRVLEDRAALLANRGFVTLALAFFGVEGLPKSYATGPIRVEYFEEAIRFLARHEKVDESSIGVLGSSKCGDICLALMAAELDHLKAVCTLNGCISSIGTTTTYRGKETEMLVGDLEKVVSYSEGVYNIKDALHDPRNQPGSIHQLERSKADLLMIVGLDDWNWKSELFADIAEERMKAVGKKNYTISKYAGMGHFFVPPFTPGGFVSPHHLVPNRGYVYFGGLDDQKKHANSMRDAWLEMFSFFDNTLKKGKSNTLKKSVL